LRTISSSRHESAGGPAGGGARGARSSKRQHEIGLALCASLRAIQTGWSNPGGLPTWPTTLHVRRVKQGSPSTHPILGDELRALRRLQREQKPRSPFVFTSERGSPFTTAGFARMIERAGIRSQVGLQGSSAHARGYASANKGHDTQALQAYLGHRNIKRTVRYTELSPTWFKDFWRS
jgi:integrase